MIISKSNDPVFIKKIPLKIWRLSDEIEAIVKLQKERNKEIDIKNIEEEFINIFNNSKENENKDKDKKEIIGLNKARSTILPSDKIYYGVAVLSEINMDNIYIFCTELFVIGQSIVIELQIPKLFSINADISYCSPLNLKSRIISDKKLNYRLVANFTFIKQGERAALREFVQLVDPIKSYKEEDTDEENTNLKSQENTNSEDSESKEVNEDNTPNEDKDSLDLEEKVAS